MALDYDGGDEVGILTRAFRQMRDHLRAYITDLNSRAYTDAMTGVKNKGAFDAMAARLNAAIEADAPPPKFAVVMLDCDHLKQINDVYGHDRGDLYIKQACRLICQVFAHSPVFRLGGDEFAALLEEADYENRQALIDEFDRRAAQINAQTKNPWEEINISKGLAEFQPGRDQNVEQVLRRADAIMYAQKHSRGK